MKALKVTESTIEHIIDSAHNHSYILGYKQCLKDIEEKLRLDLSDLNTKLAGICNQVYNNNNII